MFFTCLVGAVMYITNKELTELYFIFILFIFNFNFNLFYFFCFEQGLSLKSVHFILFLFIRNDLAHNKKT